MIYFDYDGVIGNTEVGLFDDYVRMKEYMPNLTKREYLIAFNWADWLRDRGVIGNAFEILRSYEPWKASILTTCWSVYEAKEKITYIRENGVRNAIIVCPGGIAKSEVVLPKSNFIKHLLVDNNLDNVVDWIKAGSSALVFGSGPYKVCGSIYDIQDAFDIYYDNT